MRGFTTLLLLSLCVLSSNAIYAQLTQQRVVSQNQVWFRYYNKLQISEKLELKTELENRRFVLPERNHQFIAPRIHLHYLLDNGIDVSAGVSHFLLAFPQDNETEIERCRAEFRPHQEINLRHRTGRILISHRYRFEERFFYRRAEGESPFGMRFRYRLQGKLPLTKPSVKHSIVFKSFNEIIINVGKNVNPFDQNHFYAAFEVKMDDNFGLEIGYMNWYQLRRDGEQFFNRHILRLTLHHSIRL